jgi:hypothetical protein
MVYASSDPHFRPKNRPYRTETSFPIPCYNRAMMNSEVRIAPVAAVCDRRRTDPKNPTGCWSVAAFVRKPPIKRLTPILHFPRQSSLIKPNRAVSYLDATHSQSPCGLWFGVCGLISHLAAIQSQPPSPSKSPVLRSFSEGGSIQPNQA